MKSPRKSYPAQALEDLAADAGVTMRKHLNADAMFAAIRRDFAQVADPRANNRKIPLVDALMSSFAMFSLKDQSLLAFDERRCEEPESLHGVYGVGVIPCDSQMRTILDQVTPADLRRPFRTLFNLAQRGKALEQMTYLNGRYLLALDGTGIYSSEKVSSPYCLTKRKRNGKEEYYQQMVGAALVHPERREVIPLVPPEMVIKQDGNVKQDCERNAVRRLLADFRREHPHLDCIVIEDGLSSNAPHIEDLVKHKLSFILGAKPGDHAFLFEQLDAAVASGKAVELLLPDPGQPEILHSYRFINGLSLNKSRPDMLVNILEYWQLNQKDELVRFSWVTDITITPDNVYQIMRAGRARWRIENETFNTLKNQGYNLGHNFGLGKKHLSAVFTQLMMLAFLVDQLQHLCCPLFQAACLKCKRKRYLWERIRAAFHQLIVPSMEVILRVIVTNMKVLLV